MLRVGKGSHGGARERMGEGRRGAAEPYIIDISINVPCFVIRLLKAHGGMRSKIAP